MNPLEALRNLGPGSPPPPEVRERVFEQVLSAAAPINVDHTQGAGPAREGIELLARLPFLRSKAASLLGAWLLGGGMGAAAYGLLRPPEVRIVYQPAPMSSVVRPATVIPEAPPPNLVKVRKSDERSRAVSTGDQRPERRLNSEVSTTRGVSLLQRERALLDTARMQAAAGEAELVLGVIKRHREQFPEGRLAEERDALEIQALLTLRRLPEAQELAKGFHDRYPTSMLSGAIEPALLP